MPDKPVPGEGAAAPARGRRPKRRFDPAGPFTGLFFLAVAAIFLADGLSAERILRPAVAFPVVLIGLGVVGTVRVLTRARRRTLR
ncbi:hypothetical protein [Actinomadura roseirufa]|uniref:hypothetical protein n=1 Tax=Actinomadura roseirufa TaxID=2094049 RepID=UPI0010415086|nr:hypothetical protein [Actinomadura roseirufa]